MARPVRQPGDTYYAEETVVPTGSVVQETVTEVEDGPGDLWPWLAGLGLAALLVIGYFAMRDNDSDTVVVPQNSPTPAASVVVQNPAPVVVPPAQQAPPQNTTVIVQQPPQQQQSQAPAESQAPAPSAS